MYRGLLAALACLVSLMTGVTLAHTSNQPPHQLYRIGDLKLESGDVIKDFAISYVTRGALNAKKSNAVLMVTAIGRQSSSSRFSHRARQSAGHQQILHHLHRRDWKWTNDLAVQFDGAAAH